MEKIPCSVAMLTFNSAKTLRRALESVKDFDDIVINDGGSTDDTVAIAKEYGARVIEQDRKYKYANNTLADGGGARNQMMAATTHDWYLWMDSDECISPGLHDDVARIARKPVEEGDPLAYRIPIQLVIDGRIIKYSSNYPGYQFRFFNKKSGGHLTRPVHNRIEFNPGTNIGTLKHPWYVYVDSRDIKILARGIGKSHRRIEVERAGEKPFFGFMRYIVWANLRAAASVFIKSLYQYLRHGFKDTMPVRGEVARISSSLTLIVQATLYRIRKHLG